MANKRYRQGNIAPPIKAEGINSKVSRKWLGE
jgi:hypothetical protein